MIDRYLLRYFLAVLDHGNFSRAAASCNVSQPTLSAGIAKLEAHLKRTLFHRSNRRVELTEAGAALARHARRIETEFLTAEREVGDAQDQPMLRLGLLASIPGEWVEHYVERLRAAGIGERVELVGGRERDLMERLTRGRIDAALTLLRPGQDGLTRESLFSEGYSLAMAAHHPMAGETVIEGERLADNPMIVRRHCELLSDTSRWFTARGVRPFFPARTTSDDQALRLVRAGLGVTVMPDCFRARGVVRPMLAGFPFTREVGLLFAPHADAEALTNRTTLTVLKNIIDDERRAAENI